MVTRKTTQLATGNSMVTQLPIWPSEVRGMPNSLARSALFNCSSLRAGTRRVYRRKVVAALKGISIEYSGDELRQDDSDAFMQILHVGRIHQLGTKVRFTAHSMLKELKWSTSSVGYTRLVDCLLRLSTTTLQVTVELPGSTGRASFGGSLVRLFRWKEEQTDSPMREWEIELEPEIIALFGSDSYSRIEWEMRLELSPIEKWLHSFYHSHRDPFPFKVASLRELMDSSIKELKGFRYKLKFALDKLVAVGFLESYMIDAHDLVHVVRKGRVGHREMQAISRMPKTDAMF